MQVSSSDDLLIRYSDGRLQEWDGGVVELESGETIVTLILPLLKPQNVRNLSLTIGEIDATEHKFGNLKCCLELEVPGIDLYNFTILLPCCAEKIQSATYNKPEKELKIVLQQSAAQDESGDTIATPGPQVGINEPSFSVPRHSYMSEDDMSLDGDDDGPAFSAPQHNYMSEDDMSLDGNGDQEGDHKNDEQARYLVNVVEERKAWSEFSQAEREAIFCRVADCLAAIGTGKAIQACWETLETFPATTATANANANMPKNGRITTHRLKLIGPITHSNSKVFAAFLGSLQSRV